MDHPDDKLVERARSGDRRALRDVVERYEDAVTRTVAAMLGPTAEVDDVVQEVFLRFFETIDRYRGDAPLGAYLRRMAVNRSLDVLRRRRRVFSRFLSRDDAAAPLPEPGVDESGQMEDAERDALVRRAIEALPPKHRAVVVLRMIEGYSARETADLLGVPYGTVLSRLSRAHDKLKALLAPYIDPEG